MVITDLETGGIDAIKNSILSIGAVDYDSGDEFYIETRHYPNRVLDPFALKVNGFTIEQANDPTKPYPHEGYKLFLDWIKKGGYEPLLGGHNVGSFDVQFLLNAAFVGQYEWIFGYRYVDLHSLAYAKFGLSLKMDAILTKLGLPAEAKPHNGLNGAKCARSAFNKFLMPTMTWKNHIFD